MLRFIRIDGHFGLRMYRAKAMFHQTNSSELTESKIGTLITDGAQRN